jgi:hypothetical protein
MQMSPARTAFSLLGLVAMAQACHAQSTQSRLPEQWPAEAVIRFSATSTLHDFGGEITAQSFLLTMVSNRWLAETDVLSGSMATAHEARDRKMHEMFNTNDHPRIHGKATFALAPAEGPTNAVLSLKIRDQQHDLPVRISNWVQTETNIHFHAAWQVSLKQFKLKPPSVIGVIRVGDRVTVNAEVTATKTPGLTNAPARWNVPSK